MIKPLTKQLFKMKECPKYAKYAFCCAYDGLLYFSNEHPDIECIPGISLGWIPDKKSKYKKTDIRIKSDYIERLILCKNGKDFDTHTQEIERMEKIDKMFE